MIQPALLLLDTSAFIAREQERPLEELPGETAVSVVTLAELELGVHMAVDVETRRRCLDTLSCVRDLYTGLTVDEPVASEFAGLVAHLRQSGRRLASRTPGSRRPRLPTEPRSARRTRTSSRWRELTACGCCGCEGPAELLPSREVRRARPRRSDPGA